MTRIVTSFAVLFIVVCGFFVWLGIRKSQENSFFDLDSNTVVRLQRLNQLVTLKSEIEDIIICKADSSVPGRSFK